MDAHTIIRALGGATSISKYLECGRSAVSNWPRDGIPAKYWPALSRLAQATDNTNHITLDVLEQHTVSPPASTQIDPAEAA